MRSTHCCTRTSTATEFTVPPVPHPSPPPLPKKIGGEYCQSSRFVHSPGPVPLAPHTRKQASTDAHSQPGYLIPASSSLSLPLRSPFPWGREVHGPTWESGWHVMRCDANALLHCLPPHAASQLTQTQLGPPPLAGISTRRGCCTDREVYASGGEAMTGGRQAGSFTNETQAHGRGRSCPRMEIDGFLPTVVSRTLSLNRRRAIFFLPRILHWHCLEPARVSSDGAVESLPARVIARIENVCSLPIRAVPGDIIHQWLGCGPGSIASVPSPPHTHTILPQGGMVTCVCAIHTQLWLAIHVRVIFIPQSLCASVHQGTHMHARAHTRRTCPSHVGWRGALPVSTIYRLTTPLPSLPPGANPA